MTWAKLDDGFHHHPKVMKVNLAATGLFALGLSYAAANRTDGHLPERWVRGQIVGEEKVVDQLISAGLWEATGDGYEIHDYLEWQHSRAEVERLVEQKRNAGRASGQARRELPNELLNGRSGGKEGGSLESVSEDNDNKTKRSVAREAFETWLEHYGEVTGRTTVRGSHAARQQFDGRLAEGFSVDELKLATLGCHGDDFCRDRKSVV